MIDFDKLLINTDTLNIEPRDIFMTLPSKDKKYDYPRDVQTEVWKKWYQNRNNKDNIIKMNTGSGKTVVGLLILKSCLNEGKGPAIYVVPDNYLVGQVCSEANSLGILVTEDENDFNFIIKKSILVVTIKRLINGRSIFGMRTNNNVSIGSIIIDDVHACIATVEEQFTITIPGSDEIYYKIFEIFTTSMKEQSESKFADILEAQDENINMLIPFWEWQNKNKEIYSLLYDNMEKDFVGFYFPLLKECFNLCNCMISAKKIEITPKCIPIHKISSFIYAERRIFMSATLADDSAFISTLGLNAESITSFITPEKANDIGDRLILFPQVMNKNITDDMIKYKLKELSDVYNIVIIVPSLYRSKYWRDVADLILNAENIESGVKQLNNSHVGLVVFINKYDGIDLPENACRLLVIDGLPRIRNEYDMFEQNAYPQNKRICSEQIQKIEQGMGRGVRSNSDYCVIVLMGRGLADIIFGSDGYNYFSDATKQQFELSMHIWKQLDNPDINQIMEISNYCLARNIQWISISKETLARIEYSKEPKLNTLIIALRKAFELAETGRYHEAIAILTEEKNKDINIEQRGLIKQYIADYTNFFNPADAQQILLSAISDNRKLLKPIQGVQFNKIINRTGAQAQFLLDYIVQNGYSPTTYLLKLNALLEKLVFMPETAKQFEAALKEISFLIGIYSNRPEDETGKGPDNFWDICNLNFLVIECKNGSTTETISKHDCNQLNGSINWFENIYKGNSCNCYPIMIHNSNVFDFYCSPHYLIRIMTPDLLNLFTTNIRKFAVNVAQPDAFNNTVRIHELLLQFNLLGINIINTYTKKFSIIR